MVSWGWHARARKGPLVAAAVAGAAGWAGLSALADYVVHGITKPPPRVPTRYGFTPFETGASYEDVEFTAADGTVLGGWLLRRGPAAPAILACGGHRGKRSDLLGIGSSLWRAGYNVLLFDYRGYGDEPGHVTLGYRELADSHAALAYLRGRLPAARVGALGFSMGAAVAIMLAAREPSVEAVLADSPFTSQREIVRHHVALGLRLRPSRATEPLAWLLLGLVDRRLLRRFGFRLTDVHPLQDVRRLAPRPLLLIHGGRDRIIPAEHTRRMAETAVAAGVPVEEWLVPEAEHCRAYFLDRQTYCDRARTFFGRHLGTGAATVAAPHVAERREAMETPAAGG